MKYKVKVKKKSSDYSFEVFADDIKTAAMQVRYMHSNHMGFEITSLIDENRLKKGY